MPEVRDTPAPDWATVLGRRREHRRPPVRWLRAALLFAATFFTTTTLGPAWYLATLGADLLPFLSVRTIRLIWATPEYLALGLRFSLALLAILGCHELGHFLACRYHRVPASAPYFLPAPFGLGTFGAFMRVHGPLRDRRELFDVGAAGPIAGFVALLPFLLLGARWSVPLATASLQDVPLLVPSRSLAMTWALSLFHDLPAGSFVVDYHPFALAAWVGLLVTALNLLPIGQLDGGHIVYSVFGRWHRRLALIAMVALVLAGVFFWRGWWLWAILLFFLGIRHPPVLRPALKLDARRLSVALLCLALFLLCFMPAPILSL